MMNRPIVCEVCVETFDDALAAQHAGADRIELCADLSVGGTTPSFGFISAVRDHVNIPVMVMIRPRPGDFVFGESDAQVMISDIRNAKLANAHGVVIGALDRSGNIDVSLCKHLVELARPMSVTFHRAFDVADDPMRAFRDVCDLSIDRLLTSGQADSSAEGSSLIHELIVKSNGRLLVMPGGGVNENNICSILKETGATEIHFSGRKLNAATVAGFGQRIATDPERVAKMVQLANSLA